MTKQEFAAWQAITESSRHKWTEDDIFRLNGRGNFYYIGGEDGQYIQIHKDGRLEVGTYEGAVPHIGEAFFQVAHTKQCADYNDAFKTALEKVGGKKLLVDMFSAEDKNQIVRMALSKLEDNTPEDTDSSKKDERGDGYTSVLKTIKEAKDAPKTPRKSKGAKQKNKGGDEI